MAEPYLTDLRAIVERSGMPGDAAENITCEHFFSGAAAYLDGRIFMTLTSAGLALKLGDDDRQTLFDRGGTILRYFPKAPVKRDYAVLPPDILGDDRGLSDWISRSVAFAAG